MNSSASDVISGSFRKYTIYFILSEARVYMYVLVPHVCLVLVRTEEGFGFPGPRVMEEL